MRKRLAAIAVLACALWLSPGALAVGWCGGATEAAADRPDLVTGPQVHAVVAVPADAPDTFGARAGQLADDVTSMLTWWQGQDPTRVPRWDQAAFGSASCLDISFVRLPEPSSVYAGFGSLAAFQRVSLGVGNLVGANRFKKYLVYFDGPSVQVNVCGTGAGDFFSGPSYSVVWLGACVDVPTDSTGAHELLHGLGALPAGAPHACGAAQGGSGHPCDSTKDVIYPYTTGDPLAAQFLDVNHDDYYAHSGNQVDIQDSLWLHRLDLPQVPLAIAFAGAGRVQSEQPGVDCRAACTTQWDQGLPVNLIAEGTATTRFVRWSGACSGNGDCALTLGAARSATALFGPLRVPVRLSTAGRGHISCSPACGRTFAAGDSLTLRAVATRGWRFAAWSGACKSRTPVCRPPTDYALTARATFRRL